MKKYFRLIWRAVIIFLTLPLFLAKKSAAKIEHSNIQGITKPTIRIMMAIGVSFQIFWIILLLSFVLTPATPQSNNQPQTTQTPTTQENSTDLTKPLTTEDRLWQAVDNGLKKRDNINIYYDSADKIVIIEHTDENPYSAESFVKQAYSILVLYGQEAFNIDDVNAINVQNKTALTDEYGKKNIENGVIIEMTKENFSKFEWKNLEYQQINTRIQTASDIYRIHPAIQKEIKDESKLYLVLQYSD